jgi:hypothetical protein
MPVLLGGMLLDGAAVADGIRFGGAQALVVHALPGGTRVIDAMGPDDADIIWSGYLAGGQAAERARALDAMRVAGAQLSLSWDTSSYSVVIASIDFDYANIWWIRYRISCRVVTDAVTAAAAPVVAVIPLIVSDLNYASTWCDVSAALAAVQNPGATTVGSRPYASAASALASSLLQLNANIASADTALASTEVTGLVSAAGALAGLTAARGFVARAAFNLANVRT